MTQLPLFERLEDRIVLDGEPSVTITGPETLELGAQNVDFTLTFDNVSPTDTGYGPYIDVIVPTAGPDGYDGVTIQGVDFLGTMVATQSFVFDASGQIEHPFAVDAFGDPIVVSGQEGDTLLIIELPYGSFSAGNPPIDIDLTLDFSNLTDLDQDFQLTAIPGFSLGGDQFDNPTADPPIRGAQTDFTQAQTLYTFEKANNAPENEHATGPSYIYTHTITLDIADGQSLDNIVITDTLPPEMVYQGNLRLNGAATTGAVEPTIGAPSTSAGPVNNFLQVNVGSASGTVTVEFDYYIDELNADTGAPVVPVASGDDQLVTNVAGLSADWTPIDTNDPPVSITDTALNTYDAASLAIQKSNALTTNTGPSAPTPGDIYTFTLNVQVSDYFTYGDLVVTDILGNGWEYVAGSASFTTVEETGAITTAQSLTAFETTSLNTGSGETTNVWDISAAMAAQSVAFGSDGLLTGQLADGTSSGSNTRVTITYQAEILDQYADDGTVNDTEVSQGDVLSNSVSITGSVRDNTTLNTIGTETDGSGSEVALPFGAIEAKEVYAINGNLSPGSNPAIAPGDLITFRVEYTAPLGSFESLVISDNLPQNVLDVTEITNFDFSAGSAAPPPLGTIKFGPGDETQAERIAQGGANPTFSTNGPDNGLSIDFGILSFDPRQEVTLEFLYTVSVQDVIFADGLSLTNQATAFENNSFTGSVDTTAISNFVFTQPELEITKGVVATNSPDPATAFDPTSVGPVTFNAPGSSTPFSGTISSNGLDTTPIDANIDNVDAGDLVTFAVVVENTGTAARGAYNVVVSDTIPTGFAQPPGGFNLQVRDGAGNTIPFTGTAADFFTPGTGIELTDPSAAQGAIGAFNATSGANVAIITYDLIVEQSVTSNDVLTNTATLSNFAALDDPAATDRTPVDLTDDAEATVQNVEVSKTLVSSEESPAGVGAAEVLIGEEFTFEVRYDIQEATYTNVVLSDAVRTGTNFQDYEILSAVITGWDASVLNSTNGVTLGTAGVVAGDGNSVSFNVGTLVNTADQSVGNDVITFQVTARSLGSDASLNADDRLGNTGRFQADGVNTTANGVVRVVEPNVAIDKTASPSTVVADGTVNYRIDVTNPAQSRDAPAYDVVITDDLADPNITLDAGSVVVTVNGTNVTATAVQTGNTGGDTTILVTFDEIAINDDVVITYTASVDPSVEAAVEIDNTADITYDSLPGDNTDDERDYSDSDDATVTAATPSITKDVIDTSNDETAGTDLAIGEIVTYEVVITLPEGDISGAVLTDLLPSVPGVLSYVDSRVTAIGGNITGSALAVGTEGSNSGQTTTFNFGDLMNAVDNTSDPLDQIRVEIDAIVTDVAANAAGDTLVNTATFGFDQGSVQDTASVDVVEPELNLSKTPSPSSGDAGDTITYTLISQNTGDGPAYDIVIEDPLSDAGLTATSTASIEILTSGGAVTPPTGGTPTVTYPDGGGGLTANIPALLPGEQIRIVFDAIITNAAEFSGSVDNTAEITAYDSDPADGAADMGRSYTGPEADAEVDTPEPSITKTFTTSEFAETSGASVTFGEIVTYEIEVTLPEGTDNLRLDDTLPPGLTAIGATITAMDASITSNVAQGDDESSASINVGSGGGFTVNFGATTVPGDNTPANNVITIAVTAQVTDVSTVNDGDNLTNTATLSLLDGSGNVRSDPDTGNPLSYSDTAVVNVVEPDLDLTKTAAPVTGDAGDVISFTLLSTNTGNGPAFDVVLSDDAASGGFDITASTVTIEILQGGSVVAPTGGAPSFSIAGDGTLTVDVPALLSGQSVRVSYDAEIAGSALISSSILNTATIEHYDTDPEGIGDAADDGRSYSGPSDTAQVDTPDGTIAKTYLGSGDGNTSDAAQELTIGETVQYLLTINIPEGTGNIEVTDALPDGLIPVAATAQTVPGNVSSANINQGDTESSSAITLNTGARTVSFNFGTTTITGDDDAGAVDTQIILLVEARVADVAAAADGLSLTNTATLEIFDPSNPTTPLQPPATDTETVDIVEPELTVAKTSPVAVNPGDTVPYTVEIENTGSGPAYDIQIADTFTNTDLTYNTGSITFEIDGNPVIPAPSVSPSGDGFTTIVPQLLPGETLTVEYTATLSATAPEARSFGNTVDVNYDTVPDGNPDSPTGRDYEASDVASVGTVPFLTKEAISANNPDTGDDQFDPDLIDLQIGEEVTFELVLYLPEIPMDSVVVTDSLPAGLQFVSAQITEVSGGAPGAGGAGAITGADSPAISNAGQTVTYDFGAVVNPNDGSIGTDDTIRVELVALVVDNAAVQAGTPLTNTATLDVTAGGTPLNTATAMADVDIVEPALTIAKTASPALVEPGDSITYNVQVTNTGSGPAYDVLFTDLMEEVNYDLNFGSIVVSVGGSPVAPLITPNGTGFSFAIPTLLPGQTLSVTYSADPAAMQDPADVIFDNTATVEFDQIPDGDPATPGGRPGAVSDTAQVIASSPDDGTGLEENRLVRGLGIDDADFRPLILIDPIFSGTAEPGSNVTISLYLQDGSLSYTRHILADAGGHWIAIFPRVELTPIEDDFYQFFDETRIFDAPVKPLDQAQRSVLTGFSDTTRSLQIETELDEETYTLRLDADRPSTLPQEAGMFNARTFYAGAQAHAAFAVAEVLSVDEVFEGIAGRTVADLYEASRAPLGQELNRFNYEFLTDQTATPGSPR